MERISPASARESEILNDRFAVYSSEAANLGPKSLVLVVAARKKHHHCCLADGTSDWRMKRNSA